MSSLEHHKTEREFDFNKSDFEFLSKLAYDKTGIVLAEHKKDMVYGRLARRLRALNLETFSEYCEILKSDYAPEEMDHLVNAITTNLTGFFREAHHFEHLKNKVLVPMLDNNSPKKLRIWSSACSSGMEPYSIAMTVKGAIANINQWDAKILATDIDSNMVATSIKGEYSPVDIEPVPAEYKKFMKAGSKPEMSEELKRLISFKQLNLLESWPMRGQFDVIFCRNVMIYFDKPTKQKLIERMAELLKPEGWLYIGHSENLHGISDKFELVGRTIYRRAK